MEDGSRGRPIAMKIASARAGRSAQARDARSVHALRSTLLARSPLAGDLRNLGGAARILLGGGS
ncbi:hypothetical protein SCE1572_45005 [Sorangium cellulosum So0157-2]|uniref:Uncharacterized protein n=1 Tax=Sorangium cellulosum So0157-2 TaxID=1254432 RepID=S4Y9M9_SORCE|nr:hypothetical protein SCE1572_45005 [Sorangium cellulosum So0157-2]